MHASCASQNTVKSHLSAQIPKRTSGMQGITERVNNRAIGSEPSFPRKYSPICPGGILLRWLLISHSFRSEFIHTSPQRICISPSYDPTFAFSLTINTPLAAQQFRLRSLCSRNQCQKEEITKAEHQTKQNGVAFACAMSQYMQARQVPGPLYCHRMSKRAPTT